MEWLQIVSNIAQIIGVIWVLFFGGRSSIEVIKNLLKGQRPIKWPSPTSITNVLLALILLALLSSRVFPISNSNSSTTTITPSTSPTAIAQSPSPTPKTNTSPSSQASSTSSSKVYIYLISPTLPLMIPCIRNCNSNLDVALKSVIFESTRNDIILTFSFTNKATSICEMTVDALLYDNHGIYSGQGQIQNVLPLDRGQVLPADATFSFTPSPVTPNVLTLVVSCQANMPMIYKTETLVFDSYRTPSSPPPNPVSTLENFLRAYWQVTIVATGALVLMLTFIWLASPRPFGILEQNGRKIYLRERRTLTRRLFSKSSISSMELEEYYNFDPKGAEFDLIFIKGHIVSIIVKNESLHPIEVYSGARKIGRDLRDKEPVDLVSGDVIKVAGNTIAIFYEREDDLYNRKN